MSSKKVPKHFYLEREVIELLEELAEDNNLSMSQIVNRALYFTYYADLVRDYSFAVYKDDPEHYCAPFVHADLLYDMLDEADRYGKLDTFFSTAMFGCGYFPQAVELNN